MANTKFQLKRSAVSGVAPTTGDISTAELGINVADRKLFSSNGTVVFELGSNLSSLSVTGIASVSANLTIGAAGELVITNGAGIYANGTLGTAGQVLTSNATGVYWSTVSGVNTAAQYTWTNNQFFTANLTVGNSTVNTQHSNSTILFSNATTTTTLGLTDLRIGNTTTNVVISNTTSTFGGNVVITGSANVTANLTIAATGELIISNGAGIFANGTLGTAGQVLTSNATGVYWSTAAGGGGGSTLVANNTDTQTFYIPMANTTSGTWSNAVVSTTKFYFVPSTGTLNATIFNSLSDFNKKFDVLQIKDASATVSKLRGVEFSWNDTGRKSAGVIAQEIEKVLPHLVDENNGIKSVNYLAIIGYLIESNKELQARIAALENN